MWSSCYNGEISIYHTVQPRFPRSSLGMNSNRSSLGVDLQQSGRDRVENQTVAKTENKSQSGSTNSGPTTAGVMDSLSHELLVNLSTCLIGHSVEVHVKGGSVFSGIFHTIIAEKDMGIVLKMSREIKTQGQTPFLYSFNKAPLKTFIIPYKELVQMTAKDVSVTKEDFENDLQRVKEEEIMIGSFISQNRHADAERELGHWVPDDPQCPELDNIFDGQWNREWDQFEANATLFGVEKLYTTKLERGPQMRELEREAARIAREIEEERGAQFLEHIDIDHCGYDEDEDEDIFLDSQNNETFGDTSCSVLNKSFANLTFGKTNVEAQVPSCSSSTEKQQISIRTTGDTHRSDSSDNSGSATGSEHRIQENQFSKTHVGSSSVEVREKIEFTDESRTSKPKERELERWVPDDDPQCPELDNIFDGQWNRGWDQFKANATLFGVKSTFERGPLMRELEREATA